jgi:hypothetical protein
VARVPRARAAQSAGAALVIAMLVIAMLVIAMVVIAAACARGSQAARPGGAARSGRPVTPATAPPAAVRSADCPHPSSTAADATLAPDDQNKLNESLNKLDGYATQHFPGSYAGVALSIVDDALLVYRKPFAAFDDWARSAFPHVCLVLVDAPHSQRELLALQDRIVADFGYWQAHGVRINTTAPRVDGSAVEVTTLDAGRAKAAFPQRYGAGAPIAIIRDGPVS